MSSERIDVADLIGITTPRPCPRTEERRGGE